jgi:hypothetical protein
MSGCRPLPASLAALLFTIGLVGTAGAADLAPPWVGNEKVKEKSPYSPPWVGNEKVKRKSPHNVPWLKPCDDCEVSSAQWPWQYCKSRTYMPPWISTRRVIGPIGGTWVSHPDWRTVTWDGDDKGSELHRRTQAHSLAIEEKWQRLHDWSHPSMTPDYEYLYHEPPPKFKD